MNERDKQAQQFVALSGWGDAAQTPITGDASNRRYTRLSKSDGSTAILMDSPPDTDAGVARFGYIAACLNNTQLSAPVIYNSDHDKGFLILEDLGDDLFARVLEKNSDLEIPLYEAAVDVLVHLHQAPVPDLLLYDADKMAEMAALAYDWYLFGATGAQQTEKSDAFRSAFRSLLTPLEKDAQVLIQRDYHAENLLWLPRRDGVARVGLLDFQDAMLGHPAYDLVSVLQDARRDVPPEIETAMRDRYIAATRADPDAFNTAYSVLGAQRNLRILGVFARLCMAHGKAHYVDLIPRVWGHVQTNLQHPALAPVAGMIANDLPEPTQTILDRLKSKCATIQLP